MNDALFENRKAAALSLRECIRDKGYTKVSFAKRADVSRQVLDELLDGELTDRTIFEVNMSKILFAMSMTEKEVILYSSPNSYTGTKVSNKWRDNLSERAKRQYDLLLDVIDLCAIYYNEHKRKEIREELRYEI